MTTQDRDTVIVGRLGAASGVRGQVRVRSYTEPAENLFSYSPWLVQVGNTQRALVPGRFESRSKGFVVSLEGITDRNAAEELSGLDIAVDAAALAALPEDEFYWKDLMGLAVVNSDGTRFGQVDNMMETGRHDVIVVAPTGDSVDGEERLIPWRPGVTVQSVDLDAGTITVDWEPDLVTMQFAVVTLFPEMFAALTEYGVTGRAVKTGAVAVESFDPRDDTTDRHRTVDDRPYGGGPGMLLMAAPLRSAVNRARERLAGTAETRDSTADDVKVICLSPQGQPVDQAALEGLAAAGQAILVCGRYEGIDQRFIDEDVDECWSIGDFVMSGGELAAMAVMDGVIRLLPGVLGHDASASEDSFVDGLLDHPHYTRPEVLDGAAVPEVLLSGDHAAIRRWRRKQALGMTWRVRPDLLHRRELDSADQALLEEYIAESGTAPGPES